MHQVGTYKHQFDNVSANDLSVWYGNEITPPIRYFIYYTKLVTESLYHPQTNFNL